jgi:predicted aldo/keto reductase-like oxidoreductase
MNFEENRLLGKSKLQVGRLGVSCGYGAPTEAYEEAFERGCNYFYWGFRRRESMARAIKNITARGEREKLIVVLQSSNRIASMLAGSVERGLKKAGLDYADALVLAWHNSLPSQRLVEAALRLKERGRVRFLAMSGHKRAVFPQVAEQGVFDIFHVRYNAAHRGAEVDVFPKLPQENRPGLVSYTATCWGRLLKSGRIPKGERIPRASDCYRFVLSNPNVDICLTGPKDIAQMREALKTLELGPLSEDELTWMRRVGDQVHG